MKYRGTTEIIDCMLRSIGSGCTKTHIMYKAYLSFSQLKGYLGLLESNNLIVWEAGSQRYKLTEKGLEFMNAFDKISELIPRTEAQNRIQRKTLTEALDQPLELIEENPSS